jgi:hypothetical protein
MRRLFSSFGLALLVAAVALVGPVAQAFASEGYAGKTVDNSAGGAGSLPFTGELTGYAFAGLGLIAAVGVAFTWALLHGYAGRR